VIQMHRPFIVCMQETKLSSVNLEVVRNCLGSDYTQGFCFLPASGTRGGIILACKDARYMFSDIIIKTYTLTCMVTDNRTGSHWSLTGVYGPQENIDKRLFLRELRDLKALTNSAWLVLRDFNLIYMDQDKSNDRLDRRMMTRFRRTLNRMEVREIQLIGHRFTWSNDQINPTMTRIDRAFCTIAWEELHLDPILLPHSASTSDHSPLLLHSQEQGPKPAIFRFKEHWPSMPGFLECVQHEWCKPIVNP
jgi:exonuclease III